MAQNQDQKEASMSILIASENRSWVIELDIEPNESIESVKTKIQEEKGIPIDKQRLAYAGRELMIGRTLSDYNIQDRSELCLLTPMPNDYSPSLFTGIYGTYVMTDVNAPVVQEIQEDIKEEKIDYRAQIQQEIRTIASQPDTPRDTVFELAKQKFRQEGKPVIIDTKDALSDIKQNAANYKNVALPMTLAMDKDFSTWNEQSFKRDFAIKFNVPIECIEVVSVRAGSIIADVKLHTHWKTKDGKNKSMNIEVIADAIDFKKAEKAFAEFAIFAIEFGLPTAGFDCSRLKVIMNPRWNRGYGPGATDWDGPLKDGKSRGGEPYYCPKGWKRFAIQFEESALDFAGTYDKWPIAYHGTKFDFSMMITLSGLRCSKGYPPFGAHGPGVYLSPSIKYVSHPRYCKPIKLDLSKQEWKNHGVKQDQIDDFRSYDGKWVQCAFMVRVKPGSYRKCRETMGLGTSGKFDNIEKNVIEWIVDGPEGTIIGNEKILIYGIMIRARDTRQTSYQDYE